MNAVGELLNDEDVHLDFDALDKRQLLERMAALLSRRHGLPQAKILESLIAREQLGSTGLGHGVAIPHARMPECYTAAAAFVRTRVAIPFDAPDRKPVSLFLGLVVPKHASERHLQLLATAAAMFNEKAVRENLKAATNRGAARDILAAWASPVLANDSNASEPRDPLP